MVIKGLGITRSGGELCDGLVSSCLKYLRSLKQ